MPRGAFSVDPVATQSASDKMSPRLNEGSRAVPFLWILEMPVGPVDGAPIRHLIVFYIPLIDGIRI